MAESYGFVMKTSPRKKERSAAVSRSRVAKGMAGGGSRVLALAMRREPSAYTRERVSTEGRESLISYTLFIVPIIRFFYCTALGDILLPLPTDGDRMIPPLH
jgi:hypothetical protein